MAAPEGYDKLGLLGFVDRGEYAADLTYNMGDVVFYSGSTYKVLRDNLSGVAPVDDGVNYSYLARGFLEDDAANITATDSPNITGGGTEKKTTVQKVIDKLADWWLQKLTERLVNNALTTEAGIYALDAAMGKTLGDKISELNSEMLGYYQLAYSRDTNLAEGTDLNDITTPGIYRTSSTTITQSLINCPVTAAMRMLVSAASSTMIKQEIFIYNSSNFTPMYRIRTSSGTWTEWRTMLNDNDKVKYIEHRIDDFSITSEKNYATLGKTSDFGVPSGAHVISCSLTGWANISSGNIYVAANDTSVYMFCDGPVTADYVRIRLSYIEA